MFKNTIAVIEKFKSDLDKAVFNVQIAYYAVIIISLLYSTISGKFLWANLPLLLITIGYTIFHFSNYGKKGKEIAETRKTSNKFYKWSNIVFKGLTLVATIISFYGVTEEPDVFAVASTLIMAIGWVFSLLLEAIKIFVENRIEMFKQAVFMDVEPIVEITDKTRNFFRRFTSKEQIQRQPLKFRGKIQKLTEAREKEKEEKRAEKRQAFMEKAKEITNKVLVHK